MKPAPPAIARARKRACQRHGCKHDLTLCDDFEACCPGGVWSAPAPGQQLRVLNTLGGTRSRASVDRGLAGAKPSELKAALTIPRAQWPAWAKALALFAKPVDKGIGDVVSRNIGDAASNAFRKVFTHFFGTDCRCAQRKAEWNARYPLPSAD